MQIPMLHHELRNCLNCMKLSVHVLLTNPSREDALHWLAGIVESADDCTRTLDAHYGGGNGKETWHLLGDSGAPGEPVGRPDA